MKCLWYAALAMLMGVSLTTSALAQADWGNPSQIGSYQSILASYAQGQGGSGSSQAPIQGGSGSIQAPIQGGSGSSQLPIQAGSGSSQIPMPSGIQSAPFQGAPMQTGPVMSAPIQGAPMQNIPMQSQSYTQPSYTAPAPSTVMAAPIQGTSIASPAPMGAYQPAVAYDTGIPCGGGGGGVSYAAPAYSQPVYSAPSFAAPTAVVASAGPQRNRVFGARGLFFSRNYENSRQLSYNGVGDTLYSADAAHGSFGGFEGFIASRGNKGSGWEARYFGLFPSEATASIDGAPLYTTTTLRGLQDVFHAGAPAGVGANLFDVKNLATRQTITRNTDIDSIEFNFLRNAGCCTTRRGKSRSHEFLFGFRWFQFDEDLRYDSFFNLPDYPEQLAYALETQNTLLGLQIGSRTERALTRRLSLAAGTKVGLFNNRARVRQTIYDNTGFIPSINVGDDAGTNFDFRDEANNLAVLGELDLGLIYQLTCRSRINFGYRAIGVSGVALAGDQIPYNFSSTREIREIDDSGSLILQGGYAGLEFSY